MGDSVGAAAAGTSDAHETLSIAPLRQDLLAQRYLRTVLASLTGSLLKTPAAAGTNGEHVWSADASTVWRFDAKERRVGSRVCTYCHTMIGDARLTHLGEILRSVLADAVRGDYLEAGVWRGGTGIYAQASPPDLPSIILFLKDF